MIGVKIRIHGANSKLD